MQASNLYLQVRESFLGPGQTKSSANNICSGLSADVFDAAPSAFGKRSSWPSPSLGCTSSRKQGGRWEPYIGMQLYDVESRVP